MLFKHLSESLVWGGELGVVDGEVVDLFGASGRLLSQDVTNLKQ